MVFLQAAERKHAGHSLLHGVVVIVTHLALAVFKGALAGLPVCEKQIGPGVACGFQPGLHFGAGAGAGQRGSLLCLTGLVNPQLGQRGHALLVIQAGGIGQGVVTHGHIGQAALEVQIQHAQRFLCGRAEGAGRQHIAAALRQIVCRVGRAYGHARATGQQGSEQTTHEGARQKGRQHRLRV